MSLKVFFSNRSALWVKVVKTSHGAHVGLFPSIQRVRGNGVWCLIVGTINQLHDLRLLDELFMKWIVGNDQNTCFWTHLGCGPIPFRILFHRL